MRACVMQAGVRGLSTGPALGGYEDRGAGVCSHGVAHLAPTGQSGMRPLSCPCAGLGFDGPAGWDPSDNVLGLPESQFARLQSADEMNPRFLGLCRDQDEALCVRVQPCPVGRVSPVSIQGSAHRSAPRDGTPDPGRAPPPPPGLSDRV